MYFGVYNRGNLVQTRPEILVTVPFCTTGDGNGYRMSIFFPSGLLIKSVNWFQIGNMTEHENV